MSPFAMFCHSGLVHLLTSYNPLKVDLSSRLGLARDLWRVHRPRAAFDSLATPPRDRVRHVESSTTSEPGRRMARLSVLPTRSTSA